MDLNRIRKTTISKLTGWIAAFSVVVGGYLAARFPLWNRDPQVYMDAWTYINPALTLLKGDFSLSGWRSERGPVYPVFLWIIFKAFGESNLSAVVVAQFILGGLITIALFVLGWKMTGSKAAAAVASLAYGLNVSSALFEISILSETLATLLAVCAVGVGVVLLRQAYYRAPLKQFFLLSFLEGLICASLTLCKHLFVAYSLIPVLFITTASVLGMFRDDVKRQAAGLIRVFIPFTILIIGAAGVIYWSFSNYANYGWFTFSTLSGFNLSNISGGFIEDATDKKCADYIDLYVRYRQMEIDRKNTYAMTLERAWVERIDPQDISARVEYERLAYKCSLSAIQASPDRYLKTVLKSSNLFWDPAVYSRGGLDPGTKFFADRVGISLKILKVLFTAACILWVTAPIFIHRYKQPDRAQLLRLWLESGLVLFTVLYVWIISSATEFGENRRYKAPIEPFISLSILLVTLLYFRIFKTGITGQANP